MFPAKDHERRASAARLRREALDADDARLIGRVARGDGSAFESLFHRYGPRVQRFLQRLTRRSHLIDEIVNETMFAVWRKAGSFDVRSKPSTWILGIALRRGLKATERSRRSATLGLDDPLPSPNPGPEEHVFRLELSGRLDRALASLSSEQREVVELAYFEGYSYREIALIVGCPVDTVKTRMFHARRRLRTLLGAERENAA